MTGSENRIEPGDIVSGLEPSELAEITRVSQFGTRKLVEAIGASSRRVIKRPLTDAEIAVLVKVRGQAFSFQGDAKLFLLGVEAERIRIAHQFDPLFAVNSSIVDVLPHQVEAVYRYLLPLPRIRFLLADDTGAGKTIMAGLLIKELLFRGVINKVLIITPGGLTKQWMEDEMRDKFNLHFRLVNRASFEADPGQFSQGENGFFITSIDFIARHEGCLKSAQETQWDMIVVDEAHKLSAFEYGTKIDRSIRYQAVESLAQRTDHLLFLTATPHRGRKDTFHRLLMLLDEDLFQKDELVTKRIHEAVAAYTTGNESFDAEASITKARNRFFLRRLKEEMVGWNSEPLFKPRHTNTVGYELTPEELELYNAVTKYVRSRRKEAKAKKNRNVELTLMVMQRRLASSIYAITRTLHNRLNSLDEVLRILRDQTRTASEKKRLLKGTTEEVPDDITEYEEMDESQREAVDKRIFRQVLSDDPEEVEKERDEVQSLLRMAETLRNHAEAKFSELLKVLDSSDIIRRDDEKLVIFTEHKDTMDNLTQRLTNKGYAVSTIHGGLDVDARKQAQRDFRTRAKIMVATDAAGEGINLQFCRYLINWDIPWNPNRLEQRMGRIHRYGQKDDVYVYNLVAINTREGAVLQRILTKLDIMREQMGTDRVYDVIDELLEDIPLIHLIEKSIDSEDGAAAASQTEDSLKSGFEDRASMLIALQKKQSLTSHLDLRAALELRDASDERRLQPCFIQRFFTSAYVAAGGTITDDKHFPVIHLSKIPTEVLDIARQFHLSLAEKYDTPFVFDKALVSVASRTKIPEHTRLLGPGHALFDALIKWAIRRAENAFAKGAVIVDPNITAPQRMWLVRSRVEDGRNEERTRLAHEQLSLVVAHDNRMTSTSPAALLNCTAPEGILAVPDMPATTTEDVQAWAYDHITEAQLKRVQGHRQSECDLRRDYLHTTFTDLILDLQEKLNDAHQLQLIGDDDAEERQALEKRIEDLKKRKTIRLSELDLMLRLRTNLPDVVTSAVIIPDPTAVLPDESQAAHKGVPMRRDDEVELIAMEIVMEYEKSRGWTPFDVSKDGEHYDIRSESSVGEKRFIEVKGRADTGAIILTGPEVDKLRQLGERAWLYVVTSCKQGTPVLNVIQDPLSKLSPDVLYRQVQFIVSECDWQAVAQPIGMEFHRD